MVEKITTFPAGILQIKRQEIFGFFGKKKFCHSATQGRCEWGLSHCCVALHGLRAVANSCSRRRQRNQGLACWHYVASRHCSGDLETPWLPAPSSAASSSSSSSSSSSCPPYPLPPSLPPSLPCSPPLSLCPSLPSLPSYFQMIICPMQGLEAACSRILEWLTGTHVPQSMPCLTQSDRERLGTFQGLISCASHGCMRLHCLLCYKPLEGALQVLSCCHAAVHGACWQQRAAARCPGCGARNGSAQAGHRETHPAAPVAGEGVSAPVSSSSSAAACPAQLSNQSGAVTTYTNHLPPIHPELRASIESIDLPPQHQTELSIKEQFILKLVKYRIQQVSICPSSRPPSLNSIGVASMKAGVHGRIRYRMWYSMWAVPLWFLVAVQ